MGSNQTFGKRMRTTGFPSPAEDFFEKPLDINDLVVLHPATTYLFPVKDRSLLQMGIYPGDLLLIDEALDVIPGRTVLVYQEGKAVIKRLILGPGRLTFTADAQEDVPWEGPSSGDLAIRGVVTTILHPLLAQMAPAQAGEALTVVPDLNSLLVYNPLATFFAYVEGSSMVKASIYPGDVLIVDRSVQASHESFIIAVLDGRLTLKRLLFSQGRRSLATGDPEVAPVEVTPHMRLQLWGVATHSIHSLLGPFPHVDRK
jgi:DNA polymerase V